MAVTSLQTGKLDFLGFTLGQWQSLLEQLGEPSYHAKQIMKWLHHRFVADFSEMTDLGKTLREKLSTLGEIKEPILHEQFVSLDGTRKWLVQSSTGSLVEMVFIPEVARGTLCVSSQAGCALNCSFCSTGRQGFDTNLTTSEIIGQLRLAMKALAPIYPDPELCR